MTAGIRMAGRVGGRSPGGLHDAAVARGPRRSIAIVGAGPRGLGILERLTANATDTGLDIHLVDPYPAGGGRIWRRGQATLLWMNSAAADVTLFPDRSVAMDGPARTGPTLWEWVRASRTTLLADPEVGATVADMHAGSFASRSVQSRYLTAVLDRVVAELPPAVRVYVHPDRAVDLTDAHDGDGADADRRGGPPAPAGRQRVRLASGGVLDVDAVVLAQGHLDTEPGPAERERTRFADRHGLVYVPPAYTADIDASVVPERADVLVSGLGLAFVDWVVVLCQSRGGRFGRDPDGTLRYVPSGREPVLHAGSRRGVPYHAKLSYPFPSQPRGIPRVFTSEAFADRDGPLDMDRDVWPRLAKDLCAAHYAELFTAHGHRARGTWEQFAAGFAALDWGTPAFDGFVASAVPDPADRLDLAGLDRPLAGRRFADAADVQRAVEDVVAADLARRADPGFSMDAAVFLALLRVHAVLAALARDGRIPPDVAAHQVEGRFHGFFSFLASGPPPERLAQVLALARAGIVRFLGPDLRVGLDQSRGVFTASTAVGTDVLAVRVLIDARLPSASVGHTSDPLLRALATRDRVTSAPGTGKVAVDPGQRVMRGDGRPERARFALGPWVAGSNWAPAFPRPGVNAGFFRQNDAVARTVLATVRAVPIAATGTAA